MSDMPVYRTGDISLAAPAARVPVAPSRVARDISVEIAGPAQLAGIRDAWTDLLARADAPNVHAPCGRVIPAEADPDGGHRTNLLLRIRPERIFDPAFE